MIESVLRQYGLPIAALMLFVGELGVPTGLPSYLALLIVGSLVIHSFPDLLLGVVLLSVVDVAGTALLHVLSRTGGRRILTRITVGREARTLAAMERWRRRLGGRDALAVFVLRLVPLVRLGVTVGAGLLRIRRRDFFLGAVPASVVWVGAPLSLGYLFRDDARAIEAAYAAVSRGLLLGAAAVVGTAVVGGWARAATTAVGRLRRVRAGIGLAVGVVGIGYLPDAARWNGQVGGLAALGVPALALLASSYADLRAARRTRRVGSAPAAAGLAAVDKAVTAAWAVAVAVVAAIVVALETGLAAPS